MSNDLKRRQIDAMVTEIEQLQTGPIDPGDFEAWEIVNRIERKLWPLFGPFASHLDPK